jgi:hypothetical protein
MEGNMRGPSSQDCEKSYARTGVPTAGMAIKSQTRRAAGLIQIQAAIQGLSSPAEVQASL